MDLELSGKVAIVTAGSKGIGNAVAEELANEAYWLRGKCFLDVPKGAKNARYGNEILNQSVDLSAESPSVAKTEISLRFQGFVYYRYRISGMPFR